MAHNAIRAAPCALPPRPNDRVTLSCIFGFSAPPVPIVYNDLNQARHFLKKIKSITRPQLKWHITFGPGWKRSESVISDFFFSRRGNGRDCRLRVFPASRQATATATATTLDFQTSTVQLSRKAHHMIPTTLLHPLRFHSNPRLLSRSIAVKPPISRPAPHPLPPEQQHEFELLQRQAEATANAPPGRVERHPDAPAPLKAEFDGDINPATGERGGPKREPVQRWIEAEGDWSFKGRVSDF